MPTKKEIEEAENYISTAVERAQEVLDGFLDSDVKRPERPDGCAPFYLETLGAAYAMALCHALHEGQPKDSVLEHLKRFNTSAQMSIKLNDDLIESSTRH